MGTLAKLDSNYLSFFESYLKENPIIFLENKDNNYVYGLYEYLDEENKKKISDNANRTIRKNESICLLTVYFSDRTRKMLIPLTDLREVLKNEEYKRLFINVEDISDKEPIDIYLKSSAWYHGTHRGKDVKEIYDLKLNRGAKAGDFGQGLYFAKDMEIALEYKVGISQRVPHDSVLLKGKWHNDVLDNIYYNANILGIRVNTKSVYEVHIIGNNGKKYSVKVFTRDCEEWREAIWNGWVEEKRIIDYNKYYDLILGPLSLNSIAYKLSIIKGKVKNKKLAGLALENIKDEFFRSLESYVRMNDKGQVAYQLCIYNEALLSKEVGNFKSLNQRRY